jgi:hypothetical protein
MSGGSCAGVSTAPPSVVSRPSGEKKFLRRIPEQTAGGNIEHANILRAAGRQSPAAGQRTRKFDVVACRRGTRKHDAYHVSPVGRSSAGNRQIRKITVRTGFDAIPGDMDKDAREDAGITDSNTGFCSYIQVFRLYSYRIMPQSKTDSYQGLIAGSNSC